MSLRIATYNIHKGIHRSLFAWREVLRTGFKKQLRVHSLGDALTHLNLDLLFLQEVQGRHDRHAIRYADWPPLGQHDVLAQSLGLRAVYGKNADYLHGDHGNALLTHLPVAHLANHRLSDHALEQRGLLHCSVEYQGATIHCFVAHLGLFAGGRHRQTQALIREVERSVPPDAPLIIAGDFNDWRNHLSHHLHAALNVVDVYESQPDFLDTVSDQLRTQLKLNTKRRAARTFPSVWPWLRLDRIYQRGFSVQSVQVLSGPQWAHLSDHAPLLAELALL
jgi:endonuclease/exonuclease/phosphatase family metal-dependent hydrolase